ncbi:MAG: methylenetetrahydrofolate--tRNA-(uracil(54)-C(5))-methyltransferase (FADH(2)-oxidizing) TrmFO [Chloroflexi bacterium RBG_13_68_17]|nr:MAG: methylenetetrahydrofolate--tRNA-(uracil(54)-C(5))-methyltransferase (FADH(2)-oxidizing) TrmFO [Chloroflexi bacterium RBG_13_68_17]
MPESVTVVGAGLAGSEAAWQIAERAIPVRLVEMRPQVGTGAHQTGDFAELVCSNSLGSQLPDRASGILLDELRRMGSLLVACAQATAVPAGGALAVDRQAFARAVTERLLAHPLVEVERAEMREIPTGVAVMASGPLTSPALSEALARLAGTAHLYFYDAISPIVEADSLDTSVVFRASRYARGEAEDGDYLNAPMTREEYLAFVGALRGAERIPLREFESDIRQGVRAGPDRFFEGCLPVEVIAERGEMALAFGPLRPVGLPDPRTGRRPYAVVQLRQDNLAASLYNLVGFQTNLTYAEQARVFRTIPGLAQARFVRYGQMHRNTFLNSPELLAPTLQWRGRDELLFAGQITGVEGYLGNIATGLLAGVNAARQVRGQASIRLPPTTMLGALCEYVSRAEPARFQPMKANFGILPSLGEHPPRGRRERAQAYARRAQADFEAAWRSAGEALRIATQ